MRNLKLFLFLFLLILSSCGGGGGTGSTVAVSGQFISSYVEGMKVCDDFGNCTFTDSQGKFYLETDHLPPVRLNFWIDSVKVGSYTLQQNGEIINPFKLTSSSDAGDALAKFIHGMAGDATGSLQNLNFSGIRVINSNLLNGESLADAVSGGETVQVTLSDSSGNEYSVEYLPSDGSVKLCSDGNCVDVNYRQWLVLVYMAADNSLNDYAYQDLKEMSSVSIIPQVKLVVLTDFQNGEDEISESDEATGTLITQPLNSEVDSGNYRTLESFVETYYSRYPAKNVALILWDHGDGWRSERSAAVDSTSSDYLLMFQLHQALADLKSKGISFSLIGFDECLMGMEEVLYDVKDYADYFVASEAYEPGEGWDYQKLLSFLSSNPEATPEEFGKAIVDAYREAYSGYTSSYTLTLSLFSREDVERVASDLNQLYQDLNTQTFPDFQSARSSAQQVACSPSDTSCSYYYVDLYTFALPLSQSYPAAQDIVSVINSLYRVVIPGSDERDLHGLSVYFPANWTEADNSGFSCYTMETPGTCIFNGEEVTGYYNPFAAGTYWDNFLKEYLSLE